VSLVPELGPALGRLTARTSNRPSTIPLDDLRLELVSTIFEHAAAARAFGADAAAAASALNRTTWLGAWETTVAAVAARLAERVERELQGAAVESRLPPRRHAALRLTDADRRAIAGRLGSFSRVHTTVPSPAISGDASRSWNSNFICVPTASGSLVRMKIPPWLTSTA